MATSNRPPTGRTRTSDGLTRYDLLLLVIPATFLVALVASQVSSFGLSTLLAAASVVGAIAVVDGLFVNPPQNSR